MKLSKIADKLSQQVSEIKFDDPIKFTYNPLEYAAGPSKEYLNRYGSGKKEVILVGMNPGPFGMAQTGVPFGDVTMVRDWLRISGEVGSPKKFHPKRPVLGFDCTRGEVSGERLWGWAQKRFVKPEKFFKRFFVWNYCPLCFVEESGKNFTPDKLPTAKRQELFAVCNSALAAVIAELDPEFVIGVGKFAEERIRDVIADNKRRVGTVLHPSPASPIANRGWASQAEKQLIDLGVSL